jgi:hypothetical protein
MPLPAEVVEEVSGVGLLVVDGFGVVVGGGLMVELDGVGVGVGVGVYGGSSLASTQYEFPTTMLAQFAPMVGFWLLSVLNVSLIVMTYPAPEVRVIGPFIFEHLGAGF